MTNQDIKRRERRLRHLAARYGFKVRKQRNSCLRRGPYQLESFLERRLVRKTEDGMSLDDIQVFLMLYIAGLTRG
jgi:hypothetical protein